MTKPIDIEALRAICGAATQPGPWVAVTQDGNTTVVDAHGMWVADCGAAPRDAEFIAAARTAVPESLDEIEQLRKERDEVAAAREQGLVALESYRLAGKRWVEEKVRLEVEQNILGEIIKRGEADYESLAAERDTAIERRDWWRVRAEKMETERDRLRSLIFAIRSRMSGWDWAGLANDAADGDFDSAFLALRDAAAIEKALAEHDKEQGT